MVLDFEYGINTGNRFLDFVDHDEDPEEFIAGQTQPEEKPKKSSKDAKTVTSASTKKPASKTTTTSASTANTSSNTTRTNKENLTGKSTNTDQRRQQTNVLGDNNNQQTRGDSARGGGRGFPRRGGSAGQDRPPYEGGRGGGQQRPRYNKFEGQQSTNEGGGFEQRGESWGNEAGNDNQSFGGYRGRGRGRGGPRRGNFEGGRGDGRGRGRGGRGYFNNRNFEEGSQQQQQQQQQTQEGSGWQQSAESNFDNTQPARTAGQELDTDATAQERPFEPSNRRGGRGQFRSRTFHNNRNYGSDRQDQFDREGGQTDFRHNRRQHDRQPRTNVSGVKPIEKKDGEGAHNWGSPTENPDENPVTDEVTDATGQTAPASKDWAKRVDEAEKQVEEAEKQMTLDEYKKQLEEKKRAQLEKVPQFNRRVAGEGEDPKTWQKFEHEYRKKNEGEESDEEEAEEGSGSEANESGEENDDEQTSGKKKIITIPLRFKPIEIPRGGPGGSRGGPRRGGGGRNYDRPNRDDQQRSKSPSQQQQQSAPYQQAGEFQNDEQPQQQQQQQQQSRPYRGGQRGFGRGEYRRPYGNTGRGSRGGYNRSAADPNTPDFDNTVDFPTLPKQ